LFKKRKTTQFPRSKNRSVNMKLLLLLAVVAAVSINQVTPLGTQCYQCITRHPSWELESCKTAPVTCATGNYCTKAEFGGSLTIRGCAPGVPDKTFLKDDKICKKTREYMTSNHVSAALKTEFQSLLKVFEESCPPGNAVLNKLKSVVKKKAPKKAFACKKNRCNGGGRLDAAAVSVLAAAATAIYAVKRGF